MDENNAKNVKMDAKEMEQLLREGAYAVLLEDDAEIIKEFYEADIDNLLKQRSHVLVTEGSSTGTESWLNKRKKAGKFHLATFCPFFSLFFCTTAFVNCVTFNLRQCWPRTLQYTKLRICLQDHLT